MAEAGRPVLGAGTSTFTVEVDLQAVHRALHFLFLALNDYVQRHPEIDDPIVFMAVLNLMRAVVNQQADAINLSPDQRESFNRVAVSNLAAALQADVEEFRFTWKPEAVTPKPPKE